MNVNEESFKQSNVKEQKLKMVLFYLLNVAN